MKETLNESSQFSCDLNEPKLFSHKNIPFFYTMLFCSALMVLAYLKKSCSEFCVLYKSIIYFILWSNSTINTESNSNRIGNGDVN